MFVFFPRFTVFMTSALICTLSLCRVQPLKVFFSCCMSFFLAFLSILLLPRLLGGQGSQDKILLAWESAVKASGVLYLAYLLASLLPRFSPYLAPTLLLFLLLSYLAFRSIFLLPCLLGDQKEKIKKFSPSIKRFVKWEDEKLYILSPFVYIISEDRPNLYLRSLSLPSMRASMRGARYMFGDWVAQSWQGL